MATVSLASVRRRFPVGRVALNKAPGMREVASGVIEGHRMIDGIAYVTLRNDALGGCWDARAEWSQLSKLRVQPGEAARYRREWAHLRFATDRRTTVESLARRYAKAHGFACIFEPDDSARLFCRQDDGRVTVRHVPSCGPA